MVKLFYGAALEDINLLRVKRIPNVMLLCCIALPLLRNREIGSRCLFGYNGVI